MSTENETVIKETSVTQFENGLDVNSTAVVRKPFVEPEVSVPVDVLEATTFFQAATSGGSN